MSREWSARDYLESFVFIVLLILTFGRINQFVISIQTNVFGNQDMIFFNPGFFASKISAILIWLVIILVYSVLTRPKWRRTRRGKITALSFLGVSVLLLLFSLTSATVYYNDNIIDYSAFHLSGKVYKYSDVKEVRLSEGTKSGTVFYFLVMKDKQQLDIASDITKLNETTRVEAKIDKSVPHVIHRFSYNVFINQRLPKPPNFSEFKIVDQINND